MLKHFAPYEVIVNIASLFKPKEKPIVKLNTSTKCKYCSNVYHHSSYGPMVTVYNLNEYSFDIRLKSTIVDSRRPFNCSRCGAEVTLDVKLPNERIYSTF
jgi:DNA-directed RNA polymerase subunit RPC12/RpoP